MRKIIFIICFVLGFYGKSFSCEKDSLLRISVATDSVKYSIKITFENTSNDSIILVSNFKNYFTESPSTLGFRLLLYYKESAVFADWGESSPYYYTFFDGRTHLAPQEKITIRLPIPSLDKTLLSNGDFKAQLELRYRYFIPKKRELKHYYIMSNKFLLYWK